MRNEPLKYLERWQKAGLIDETTAARIAEFEASSVPESQSRLGAAIAWGMGAVLIGAGIISFVASNWQELSPTPRLLLIVLLTAAFHVAASVGNPAPSLKMALHGVGTAALGAGIALTGQTFNLDAGWNGWMMLWLLGAAASWYLLRDSVQLMFVAVLLPLWLHSEWDINFTSARYRMDVLAVCWSGVGLAYVFSRIRPLIWLGALIHIPAIIVLLLDSGSYQSERAELALATTLALLLVAVAAGLLPTPFDVERGLVVLGALAVAWASNFVGSWMTYLILGVGYVALCAWAVRRGRPEAINLGIAGFAISVVGFYVSHALNLFGGSLGLVILGLLMLGGGFALERMRRRLLQEVS